MLVRVADRARRFSGGVHGAAATCTHNHEPQISWRSTGTALYVLWGQICDRRDVPEDHTAGAESAHRSEVRREVKFVRLSTGKVRQATFPHMCWRSITSQWNMRADSSRMRRCQGMPRSR